MTTTALVRVCALGMALTGALLATPAFADGGGTGGSVGGVDNPTGVGGSAGGFNPDNTNGFGAGGGAGITGGDGSATVDGGFNPTGAATAGGSVPGGDGANGADAGSNKFAGGGGGGAHGWFGSTLPGVATTGGNGGNGGNGGDSGAVWSGGGGAGGYGAVITGSAGGTLSVAVTGGHGGNGGNSESSLPGATTVAGWGGTGGVGLYTTDVTTLTLNAQVSGGVGGMGGSAGGGQTLSSGRGGAGGAGFVAQSAITLHVNAQVSGGAGGAGGLYLTSGSGFAYGGGNGGAGIVTQSTATLDINAAVVGGRSGAVGQPGGFWTGAGGTGILASGGGTITVNSMGSVTGGDAADYASVAGEGINGSNLTVINKGGISGGLFADGSTRANAITFTGGTNVYEMWAGSSLTGNVVDNTGNGTFRLGGATNGSFDVSTIGSTYQGFSTFQKSGASTWTLTGTQSGFVNWSLLDGTLSISNVNAIGFVNSLNFNGGTLRFTGASAAMLSNTLTWGVNGGGFDVSDAAGTLIVSGSMSGIGQFTKLGAGALTLTGTSDYTGATSVNAGTLAAGSASAFSSRSAYTVASGARLDLNGYDQTIGSLAGAGSVALGARTLTTGSDNTSTAFSGVISGNGGLTKTGTGVMTLSGVNTYSGATIINGGTLMVDGSIAASSVQVNAGAMLASGSGTPGSSMTAASLAFQSGAFYVVNLNPSTSSFANVTGTATLGGAKVNANFANGNYLAKRYTILSAGNIVGAFDPTIIGTNAPTNINSSLSYDTTHAYIDVALNFTPPPSGGFGSNQSGVGTAITDFFNRNGGIPMAFSGLTPQGLTQVSGEIGGSAQGTSAQAATQFMNVMSDPTAAGRGGAGSGGGAAGYADEAMAYAPKKKSNNPRDAFASFTKAPPIAFVPRWSTWAMGYGGAQTTDGNVNAGTNTSSSNIYGVAVGADYSFSPDTIAGFALSGGGTNYSVVNGGTGRSDLFQLGAFVRHNIGATYLTASAAYGWQDVKTDRYVTVAGVDRLQAEFNTNSYSGRLEAGHRFVQPWFGGLGVSPYAAVQVTAFELPAYAELAVTGNNTFALAYGANTSTATRSELGLRTDKSFALDGAVLTLRGRAAWAHDFNPNSAVSATFQTLPGASFVVNGAALTSDAALTTATAEFSWMNGWSVAATFEGEFSDVTRSYAGKGVVRYNW